MNQYFFKMTNEERTSILDQHKHVYDGYVTNYAKPNEQPLYTQDFANDKGGVTINNKGQVTTYKNMGINESIVENDEEEDDSYMVSVGEQLDMIGDGEDDLEHGTFEDDDDTDIMLISPEHDEYDNEEDDYKDLSMYNPYYGDDEDPEFEDMDIEDVLGLSNDDDEEEDEIISSLQEQVNKSLDMFRRFKNL
jgi:hypothetical protein